LVGIVFGVFVWDISQETGLEAAYSYIPLEKHAEARNAVRGASLLRSEEFWYIFVGVYVYLIFLWLANPLFSKKEEPIVRSK
jgi:hypothetical protein